VPDYDFDYKGTLPLDYETFPEKLNIFEEGKMSNIYTGSYEVDGKHLLMPGMMEGESLTKDQIYKLMDERKHFGVYDTKEELDQADHLIHEWFKKLKGGKNVSMTREDKIINLFKDL
jgi:hypothetical protein